MTGGVKSDPKRLARAASARRAEPPENQWGAPSRNGWPRLRVLGFYLTGTRGAVGVDV